MFELSPIYWLVLVLIVIVICGVAYRRSRPQTMERFLTPNIPRDTVVLHQYGPAVSVPSISPFVMKLETYLRVAKIPYINKFSRKPGPKEKLPWVQYNDRIIPDSQFCVEFLNEQLQVNLNKHLNKDQWAIGHLIRRTVEESLYWTMLMFRLVFDSNGTVYRKLGLPTVIIWYMRKKSQPRLWSQGMGRHTQEEVTKIMEEDLKAVSILLGEKNFLFGNSPHDVTEFDCAFFGQMCQMVWQMPGNSVEDLIATKYPNLVRYCERMKKTFWPDWEQRLKNPVAESKSESNPNTAPASSNEEISVPELREAVARLVGKDNVIKSADVGGKTVTSYYTTLTNRELRQSETLTSRSTKVSASKLSTTSGPEKTPLISES